MRSGRAELEVGDVDTGGTDAALSTHVAIGCLQRGAGPFHDAVELVSIQRPGTHLQRLLGVGAPDGHGDLLLIGDRALDLTKSSDRLAIDRQQQVSGLQLALGIRATYESLDAQYLACRRI